MNYEAILELLYQIRADLEKRHIGAAQRNVNKLVTHFQHHAVLAERVRAEEICKEAREREAFGAACKRLSELRIK